jgi:NAD-dependent DNA ligase
MLADGILEEEESQALFDTLEKFSGGNFELGEILKSCQLPLDEPPPTVRFSQRNFCLTGTFAFGTRKDCEAVVTKLGGKCGSLNQRTNFLVIGVYATESWKHSSYGLKIENAVKMKHEGGSISIISETHWVDSIRALT